MTASIWKLKNIVPITKMGIEATVATASLATAITMILAITEVIAPPLVLLVFTSGFGSLEAAIIGTFAAIAVLSIAAVYFVVAACASYQQMHAIENARGEKGPQGDKGEQGDQGEKGPQGDKTEVVQALLNGLKEDNVKQQFKTALDIKNSTTITYKVKG